MIHDLEQHIEDVRMCLFDFVQQKHAMRLLGDGFRQQAALIKADIPRWRANETADGMALHVLGHVEAHQFNAERICKLLCHLCLANTRWAAEEEGADGLVGVAESRTRHLDGTPQCLDGRILAEHDILEVALEGLQGGTIIARHRTRRNTGDLGNNFLDLVSTDGLLLARFRQDALRCASLVDDVNGLVREVAVIDVAGRQFGSRGQGRRGVANAVMFFESRLQALQNLDGFGNRRLADVNFLEAARKRMVFLEDLPELTVGGCANAFQGSGRQRWLEQVGRVQRPS